MILVRLINIILVLIISFLVIKVIKNNKVDTFKPFNSVWNQENYTKIKNLTIKTQICFEKLNIEFVPVYGTLLGLVRHKGLIPWDDDMDISVDKKYFDLIMKNKELFNKYGIDVYLYKSPNMEYIKIFYKDQKKIKNYEWSWPFIDVFGYYVKDDKFYIESNEKPYYYEFKKEDVLPFKTNLFENIPMNIPNNVDNVLTVLYGNDWEDVCYSSGYNHENEDTISKRYKIKCKDILDDNNFENIFENVWVINLERRPDRLTTTLNRLKNIGIFPKIHNALDSKNEHVIDYFQNIPEPKRSIGEVSCYLSHKTLWAYIYSLNIPYAIIFEDDIVLEDNISKQDIINRINDSKGFNIILLGHCYANIKRFENPLTVIGTAKCLNAYVVTREAIKKMLDNKDDFSKAIDHETEKFCDSELCYVSNTLSPNHYGQGIIKQENHYTNTDLKDRKIFLKDLF